MIGDYELVQHLGSGAFGDMWEAEHAATKQRVAIKLLRAELTPLVDIARFGEDARALARIAHAGIARIHDVGKTGDGRLYLVRDLVAGESLANRLKRGRFSSTQAAETAQQIARALHVVTKAGLDHHDLKPSNIRYVIDPSRPNREQVIIVDFGMAPFVATAIEHAAHPYLAPEQWSRGASHAADVYALGCLLFEMICVHPPFGAATGANARFKHLHDTAPDVSSLVPDVAKSLDRLIALMLLKQPERRPHSFSDVARLLDMIVGLEAPLAETVKS
jgi:serine/threonine-protein kinase